MTMPQTTNDTKPLYAVAGLADLAAEKLRALPAQVPTITERAESAATSVRDKVADLPADVQRLRLDLPADVRRLRDDLPTLLHNAQTRFVKSATDVADAYDELSERGEGAVKRFRHERSGEVEYATVKVADTADRAANAADKMAGELAADDTQARNEAPATSTTKAKDEAATSGTKTKDGAPANSGTKAKDDAPATSTTKAKTGTAKTTTAKSKSSSAKSTEK